MALIYGEVLAESLRPALYDRLRRKLPDAIWGLSMQGSRLLVAQDTADDMYHGLIHKPRTTIEKEQSEAASGWVIAVGPQAGLGTAPHPHGIQCSSPLDLLGLHVYYQMWAGKIFRTDEGDQEFGGRHSLLVLTDRDIQAFDERLGE